MQIRICDVHNSIGHHCILRKTLDVTQFVYWGLAVTHLIVYQADDNQANKILNGGDYIRV